MVHGIWWFFLVNLLMIYCCRRHLNEITTLMAAKRVFVVVFFFCYAKKCSPPNNEFNWWAIVVPLPCLSFPLQFFSFPCWKSKKRFRKTYFRLNMAINDVISERLFIITNDFNYPNKWQRLTFRSSVEQTHRRNEALKL